MRYPGRVGAVTVDFYHQLDDGFGKILLRDSATGEWMNYLPEEREARLAEREARLAKQAARGAAEARARAAEARAQAAEAALERLRSQASRDTSAEQPE